MPYRPTGKTKTRKTYGRGRREEPDRRLITCNMANGANANPIKVALGALFEVAGDRDVKSYTREDARALLVHLKSTGIKTSTIRKRLACVGAIINYAYHEP